MKDQDISILSAVQMAEAVRKRKLSPVEITEAILRRVERLNPLVNAYCTVTAEYAMQQAKEAETSVMKGAELGPLHGVPVSVKDSILTKGIRTTAGSKIYADYIPEQDAVTVQRLKKTGAIIIGKTNMGEFGWLPLTYNSLFGETHNPWNLEYATGGSSGGAAAALAMHMGPIAIGTDVGGSIRIPASFCSVFGIKATYGLVPQYPDFPRFGGSFVGWSHLLHTGPMANTVEDAALALEVIAGRDDHDAYSLPLPGPRYLPLNAGSLKGLKIAWSRNLGHVVMEPEVVNVVEKAVQGLATLGAHVEEKDPSVVFPEQAFSTVVGTRLATVLGDKLEKQGHLLEPRLATFLEHCMGKTAREFNEAVLELLQYRDSIQDFSGPFDMLVTPTSAVSPFPYGIRGVKEIAGKKVSPINWIALVCPFNITGQPAASIPCGWTKKGLPVGMQIVGKRLSEGVIFRVARAFEHAFPWAGKSPALD